MSLVGVYARTLNSLLPKELKDSLLCYTLVNYKVNDETPDITTCNSSMFLYEVKDKRILTCLKINECAKSISCAYLLENEIKILFYLVYTASEKLLIIRRFSTSLKVVKIFNNVKKYQVHDFECLGYPQIKISTNEYDNLICKFPVKKDIEKESQEFNKSGVECLNKELEELVKYADELTDELYYLKKLSADVPDFSLEQAFEKQLNFSSQVSASRKCKIQLISSFHKVLGDKLTVGIKFENISDEHLQNLDFVVNEKNIKTYDYAILPSLDNPIDYIFPSTKFEEVIKPMEKFYIISSFKVHEFIQESDLFFSCYITCENSIIFSTERELFLTTSFNLVCENFLQPDEELTAEHLMTLKNIKLETLVDVQMDGVEDDAMESYLIKYLGFKKINNMKDKLFYCTSTYLNEVFIALKPIAVNPSIWNIRLFTSDQNQVSILLKILQDLLPENAIISIPK